MDAEAATKAPRADTATIGRARTATIGRARPSRVAAGGLSFVGAWATGFAIARLTGAAAVALLLVAGAVAAVAAFVSGWWRIRTIEDLAARGPGQTSVGEQWPLHVVLDDPRPRQAALSLSLHPTGRRDTVAVATDVGGGAELHFTLDDDAAGTITSFTGWIGSLGTGGLVWWRRPVEIEVDPIRVAPRPDGPRLPVDETAMHSDGVSVSVSGRGPATGDPTGVRPWRPGESNVSIHWPSTVRTSQLITREREVAAESRWTVPIDNDPARVRRTLDDGIRMGHGVEVVGDDLSGPIAVRDHDEAARWATEAADRRAASEQDAERHPPFWNRPLGGATGGTAEPTAVPASARWAAALAAAIALNMLLGALENTVTTRLLATAGVIVGAALSLRFHSGVAPMRARIVVTLLALGALARIGIQASGIGGLIEALRGPMPDLLVVLLILHGVESVNRRTVRFHLAITAVVVAYAAGLRIDDRVGWWLLAWGGAVVATSSLLGASPTGTRRRSPRRVVRAVGWLIVAMVSMLFAASFVPIPDGPADLGLPALSNDDAAIDRPGSLVGPDGEVADASGTGDPARGALGTTGGYRGFSETLDTSVRGGLGDEIVMRVRAPEPAFWRGQTFSDFDGRTWRVSDESGPLVDGPRIDVPATLGDLPFDDIPTGELRQTFHVDADLPNLVFAAARPSTLVFDGAVNLRPDGALRADRTLTAGTIYTVVSERVEVTEELLRSQGDLAAWFAPAAGPGGDPRLAPFLDVPASTSRRTIDLATELRVEGSTYDTIRAYERWLGANTEYDLDAPVPAAGEDAVDDFLFESRLGFCEQIASSLVVMLRSQGVPARLATGYVPGERDRVSGVWKVRARDAHAWVEVWFPVTGWQAFDPTADVPLAGEASTSSVGGDAAAALIDAVTGRAVEIALAVGGVLSAVGLARLVANARRRRARGPWGRLYDRFDALAVDDTLTEDDAPTPTPSARARAATISARLARRPPGRPSAPTPDPTDLAELFDRVAFDPDYTPTDDDLEQARTGVATLERTLRGRVRTTSS